MRHIAPIFKVKIQTISPFFGFQFHSSILSKKSKPVKLVNTYYFGHQMAYLSIFRECVQACKQASFEIIPGHLKNVTFVYLFIILFFNFVYKLLVQKYILYEYV